MPYFRRETPPAASYDRPDARPIVDPGVQVVRGRRVRGIAARPPLSEVEQRIAPRAFGSRLLGGPRAALGAVNMNTIEAQAIRGRTLPTGSPGGTGQPSNVRFGATAISPNTSLRTSSRSSATAILTGPVYPTGDQFNTGTGKTPPGGSTTTTACYSRAGCAPQPVVLPPKPAPSSTSNPLQIGSGIGSPNVPDPGYQPYDVIGSPPLAPPSMVDSVIAAVTPYKTPLLLGGAALAAYYLFRK